MLLDTGHEIGPSTKKRSVMKINFTQRCGAAGGFFISKFAVPLPHGAKLKCSDYQNKKSDYNILL